MATEREQGTFETSSLAGEELKQRFYLGRGETQVVRRTEVRRDLPFSLGVKSDKVVVEELENGEVGIKITNSYDVRDPEIRRQDPCGDLNRYQSAEITLPNKDVFKDLVDSLQAHFVTEESTPPEPKR